MRVLASVLLGATAVSATATKVAKNDGAPALTGATIAARKTAERTKAVTQCLAQVMEVLNLNLAADKQLTTDVFDPVSAVIVRENPVLSSSKVTANAFGYYGGLCADSDQSGVTPSASVNTQVAPVGGTSSASDAKPTEAQMETCVNLYGHSVKDNSATDHTATKMSDVVRAQIFGGTTTGSPGAKNVYILPAATGSLEGEAVKQDGAEYAAGIYQGASAGGTLAVSTSLAELQIFASKTTVGTASVSAEDLQKIMSLQHGACQTAFLQERMMAGAASAASTSVPFKGTALSIASWAKTLHTAELEVSRALGYVHIGILHRQLMDVYYKAAASHTAMRLYAHIPFAASGILAHTDADDGAAGTDMLPTAYLEHECMGALMKIYKANGAAGSAVTTTGLADATKLLKDTTLYDCLTGEVTTTGAPCTRGAVGSKDSDMGSGKWGVWTSSYKTNSWGVPQYPTLAGSTMFTVDYPEFTVAADDSAFAAFACTEMKAGATVGSSKRARLNYCKLGATIPNNLKVLSPLFKEHAYMEISKTGSTFAAATITGAVSTFTAGSDGAALQTKIRADLAAGTTVRIVPKVGDEDHNDGDWATGPTTAGELPHSHWQYKKATNLNPGGTATCNVVRAQILKIRTARCDFPQALINTETTGSIENAFAIAYGKRTHHINSDSVVVPVTATGWLPQLAADCGFAAADACAVGKGGATADACTHCAKGKYSAVTTVTACSDCGAGKYSDETGNSASAHCKTCPKGKWSAKAASSCSKCAAGTYGDATGLTAAGACKNCTAGTTTAGAIASTNCSSTVADATTKASGALSRFSALAITFLLALIAM